MSLARRRQAGETHAVLVAKVVFGVAGTVLTITLAAATVPAQTAISNLES
jgi:hypothetical protein